MSRRKAGAARRRGHVLAGWRVVTGAFLVVLAGFGAIYSYAAFNDEIAAAFEADMVSVSVVYALSGGTCFLVSAVSGPLADRIGPRVPALAGMVLVSIGLLVAASARSLVEIHAGYGLLIGLGTGFAYVPAMAAVQRCFDAYRGLASGIAASGIGVGTALVPPAAEALLAAFDWRTSFVVFAGFVACTGILGALLLQSGGPRPAPREPVVLLPDVVRSRAFARAWAGTLLVSIPATLPHALLVGTARDLGIGRGEALALLGLIGLGTIAGRFLIAVVADGIGRRATFLACCIGMAASMLGWALAETEPALQAFALTFGALQGGFVALLPAYGADSFGARSVGAVLGVLYTSRGASLLLAPPLLVAGIAWLGPTLPLVVVALLGLAGTVLLARVSRTTDDPPFGQVKPPPGIASLPARRPVAVPALMALLLLAVPARGEVTTMDLLWATPALEPGEAVPCSRLLVLNLPRDWQAGDAAVILAGPQGAGGDVLAVLIAQQTAVLELPDGRGGGIGPCAAAPVVPGAQVLGALAALRHEAGAGVVVAIGLGPEAARVLDALDEARAARLLGATGPRLAAAAVIYPGGPAAFRAGAPPPPAEAWPSRAPHLCETLARFAAPGGLPACLAALLGASRETRPAPGVLNAEGPGVSPGAFPSHGRQPAREALGDLQASPAPPPH
ncbi:MFS transporter [Roseomonas fluvialis]|uniref:Major facilitator superfamily (MFS) profile domain-containing protein n=1 Tax=Roseomonas fluvialis TaxID=1750527 RepID=A0ABM7Y6I7_9PROT|nr:MFS transporter [Roseomonas fluvialis]BDG73537.1 hypothetical protein Rmf_34660 [Roseomonas fluvialis]